jgi:hypothetical protein
MIANKKPETSGVPGCTNEGATDFTRNSAWSKSKSRKTNSLTLPLLFPLSSINNELGSGGTLKLKNRRVDSAAHLDTSGSNGSHSR